MAPEIFVSIISIISGFIIFIARTGFDRDLELIIISVFVSFYIIFFPKFIKFFFNRNNNKKWYFSESFLIVIGFALVVFGGQLNRLLDINLSYFFAIAGILQLFFVFTFSLEEVVIKKNLLFFVLILLIFVLFSIWVTSAYYFNLYLDPLMKEKIINGSWAHRDSVYHASIAGMLKTYGIVTLGLDGINVPFYYHTFSHYIFGLLSALLEINTITFYALIFPIIIIPFFFLSFIYCTICFHKIFINEIDSKKIIYNSLNYWILLFALFAIPFPVYWIIETYQYLLSQSYSLALASSFILFGIISTNLDFFIKKKLSVLNISDLFFLTILLILFTCISLSKFSFLYFITMVFIFFYIRKKLFYNLGSNLILIGIILISVYIYISKIYTFQLSSPFHGFETGGYITRLLHQDNLVPTKTYYLFLYPSILYIIIKLNYLRIFAPAKIFNKLVDSKLLDIELLIILCIGLLLFPYQYTKGIQIYAAYVLLLSNIELLPKLNLKLQDILKIFKKNQNLLFYFFKKILLVFIFVFIFLSLLDNIFLKSIGKLLASNLTIREYFYLENNIKFKGTHDEAGERYLTTHRKYRKLIRSLDLQKISDEINILIKINPNNTEYREEFKIISLLYKLSNESINYKQNSLIYIPKSLDSFWNISCDTRMTPFVVPAISNIAMIEGLPVSEKSCYGKINGYGYIEYKRRDLIGSKSILSKKELCKKARILNFKRVIEINKDQNNIIKKIVHECL